MLYADSVVDCNGCKKTVSRESSLQGAHPAAEPEDFDSGAVYWHPLCLAQACIQEATLNDEKSVGLAAIAQACIAYNNRYH